MLSRFVSRKISKLAYTAGVAVSLSAWTYWGIQLSFINQQTQDDSYMKARLTLIGITVGLCAGILPSLSWPVSVPVLCWYHRPISPKSQYADLSDEYPQAELNVKD